MFKLWLKLQLWLAVSSVLAVPCSITIPTDLPDPLPVIATREGLLRPTNEVTEVSENEKLYLHCPGRGNALAALKQITVTLVCSEEGYFYNLGTEKRTELKDLKCKHMPTAELLKTDTSCANGDGVLYEVGFRVYLDFHSVFTICYDSANERTVYTQSLLNGAGLNLTIAYSRRPAFRADGMRFTTTATNKLYQIKNQLSRFAKMFGAEQTYVNRTSFLARGHLTPDADFIFPYEQVATFFYANVAPEWQAVNAGNWLRVENAARRLAASLGSDLLTFTGILGELELPHPKTGHLALISLDKDELIYAPKFYYKVLMHPELPVDLVFVTLNNPFASASKKVEFCTNVCEKYGLADSAFQDASHGYTFCCEMNDFWANALDTDDATDTDEPYYDLPEGWSYKTKYSSSRK